MEADSPACARDAERRSRDLNERLLCRRVFANPLGLLALLALPIVVALHLFRRRFRPRVVSALFLWGEPRDTASAGRRRERLLRSPSFWSELAAALCFALALAGPRSCGASSARHLVLVFDGSASMSARGTQGSAAERALEAARRELDALPGGSRATSIVSGRRPRVLAGPAALVDEARERLADYRPAANRHDLGESVALAIELAGGGPCILYTDRFEPDAVPREVELRALGEPLDDVAIARAGRAVNESGTGERVLVTLASYARSPRRAHVSLAADSQALAERDVELAPSQRVELAFSLPEGAPPVEVCVDAGDALAIDDRALLLPPPRRRIALASGLDERESRVVGLMDASGKGSRIARWLAIVPESFEAPDPALAQLAIARGPIGDDSTWCLTLESDASEHVELLSPFLVERGHPWLAGVALDGVVWSACEGVALGGIPLVSAGQRVLLAEDRESNRVLLRANVDPARSTLWNSPDWPILLANLAEARRRELPGPGAVNLASGESLLYRTESPGAFVLRGPDGERTLFAQDLVAVDDLEQPGLYVLQRDGRDLARYALSFADEAESDLRSLSSGHRAASTAPIAIESSSEWTTPLLLALALAFALLDVWVLRQTEPAARGRASFRSR